MHKPASHISLWKTLGAAALTVVALTSSQRAAQPQDEALRRNNLGVGLMDAGTKDPKYITEAVREFETALSLSPDYPTARLNLGIALYYAGATERAARTLEAVLRDQPGSLAAHFVVGLLREYAGQYDAATRHFQAVAEVDPGDADAWYHLGFCLSKANRQDEAANAFRRAAALAPYQRRIRYGLFTALSRAGRTAEAQAELEEFRSLATSQIRVVEGPKNTLEYLKQGRYAEAIADSRQKAAPPRAPLYVEIGREVGVVAPRGHGLDVELSAVIRGEARPAPFFAAPQRQASIVAATSMTVAFVDVENDGRLDVYALMSGAQTLYSQRAAGRFVRSDRLPASGRALAAVWGDLDNDGWTDLVLAQPARLVLFSNDRGRLRPWARGGIRLPAGYSAASLAVADIDHDGDLDIAAAGGINISRPRKTGQLRFPVDFEPRPNLLLRNNSDGSFTEIGSEVGLAETGAGAGTFRIWFGDVDDDRAIDAVLVDGQGAQTVFLNRKDGTFAPARSTRVAALPPTLLDQARAYGDFNRDGAVDELVVGPEGVRLHRNDARPSHWLTVRPRGYVVPGKVKSNRLGIGTKLEVRSSGFWERRELRAGNGLGGTDAAEVTFDLGSEPRLDFVRAIFPSGVRRTETWVASNQTIALEEPLLDVNSCPTLFTWNGTRFEFITDTLSAGILGELVAPGQYWQPDPDEWVRIEGRQLMSDGRGAFAVRFTNPLEEVTYLDAVRLVAVDHPRDMEVYTDERMVDSRDNGNGVRLFAVARPRPLSRATDHHGHDVSAILASSDRRYFDHFAPRPFKGFAGDWALTLDLGPLAAWPVLGIEGWSYWNSSAAIVAATQAGEGLWGPVLEVRDRAGRWRRATDDLGLVAGLPRTMLADLRPYLRPGEHVVRIRGNRTLYYDRIWVGDAIDVQSIDGGAPSPLLTPVDVRLSGATLRWLGYPRRRLPGGELPEFFDYHELEQTAEWGTHAGLLTRYGDVRDLLVTPDDRLVVMGHGEEVALEFDGVALPPPGEGMRRTFFFYGNGFEKGYEINSAYAETVGPLPYRDMPAFPFDPSEGRFDASYAQYQLEWNTRPAFMRVPR